MDPFGHLLPRKVIEPGGSVPVEVWEINQTIPQLAYLTHSYFRYYGKFPSTLGAQLIEDYPPPADGSLLDVLCGSGTSLVEASRRGIPSVGVDLNPLASLATEVKTAVFDPSELESSLTEIVADATSLSGAAPSHSLPDSKWLEKWFRAEAISELTALREVLLALPPGLARKFFWLAFFAIIRRVSNAYDGEVRPHINKGKKPRSPISVYLKNTANMIAIAREFNELHPDRVPAQAIHGDASDLRGCSLPEANYWLTISHPPYLNCFDYLPVFSLELRWSEAFADLWGADDRKSIRKSEIRSWPASTESFRNDYFERLAGIYAETYRVQPSGGVCAVVIGDCTVKGELIPVLELLPERLRDVGYELEKICFRTTHYATGKYSYEHRAHYHGDDAEKRDGVLIFRK